MHDLQTIRARNAAPEVARRGTSVSIPADARHLARNIRASIPSTWASDLHADLDDATAFEVRLADTRRFKVLVIPLDTEAERVAQSRNDLGYAPADTEDAPDLINFERQLGQVGEDDPEAAQVAYAMAAAAELED